MKSIGIENGDESDDELLLEHFDKLVLYGTEMFSAQELFLFRVVCQRMDATGEDTALFSFDELKHLLKMNANVGCDVSEELQERCAVLLDPYFKYSKHSEHFALCRLFESVKSSKTECTVSIRATEYFVNLMLAIKNEKGIIEWTKIE